MTGVSLTWKWFPKWYFKSNENSKRTESRAHYSNCSGWDEKIRKNIQNLVDHKGIVVRVKGEVVISKQRTSSRERRPSISELDQRLRWVFKLMLRASLWLADNFRTRAPTSDHQLENPPSALNNFDYSSFLPRELRNLDQHQVTI